LQQWPAHGIDAVFGHPSRSEPGVGGGLVTGDVPPVQHQLLTHVLGEPRHLHGATCPGGVGIGRDVVGGGCYLIQAGHPVLQRHPQIRVI